MHWGSQNAAVPMIDKKKTTAEDRRKRLEERLWYHEGRSVRDGWSIASVTRSGGLADECILLAVSPACQIAVVFATYQDSEATNLLVSVWPRLYLSQIHSLLKKKRDNFSNSGSCLSLWGDVFTELQYTGHCGTGQTICKMLFTALPYLFKFSNGRDIGSYTSMKRTSPAEVL